MSHIGYGFVSYPADAPSAGPLANAVASGMHPGGRCLMHGVGWFCRGCKTGAPAAVGVMPFMRAHMRCGTSE